ncbi:MAG: hypothetical protein ACJ8F7_12085 [Gemmataceae bacterium]
MNVIVTQFAVILPLLGVCLVGAILAILRWPRHPQASGFALGGFGVLALNGLILGATTMWLTQAWPASGWSSAQYGLYLSIIGTLRAVFSAAGLALLVVAIFIGRASARPRESLPELPDERTARPSPSPNPDTSIREGRLP